MTDIDFEELDKAVNKLVSPQNTANQDSANPPATPTTPQADNSELKPKTEPKGRFMDVVHSSSDMTGKDQSISPSPSQSVPHQARKSITPLSDIGNAKTPVDPPVDDNSQTTTQHTDWPDPIELAQPTDSTPPPTEKPAAEPKTDPIGDETTNQSPFLSDSKVEKRPLGGVNPQPDQPTTDSNPPPSVDKLQAPSHSENLPPELDANLVAIEENEINRGFGPAITPKKPSPPEPLIISDNQSDSPQTDTKPTEPAELSGLLAAGSIPQQYESKPVSTSHHTSDSQHPMFFDADHYDKSPESGPHKRSSKVSTFFHWLFIFLGLILLGASVGAAVFFFVSSS